VADGDELHRISVEETAQACLRRLADLKGLDANELAFVIEEHWPETVLGGAGTAARSLTSAAFASSGPAHSEHSGRFSEEGSLSLGFTQTAQVQRINPVVAEMEQMDLTVTGAFPVYKVRPVVKRAPFSLRLAVCCTALLLILGLAGLASHRWAPQWLAALHLTKMVSAAPVQKTSVGAGRVALARSSSMVTETSTAAGSASVAVEASRYAVIIEPSAPVWIEVRGFGDSTPVFAGILSAGEIKTFPGTRNPMSVELGASKVTLQVQVASQTVSGWSFVPVTAPFALTFTSAAGF